MLVFIRRQGESVTIGGDVRITVLGIIGDQVRLGITAPRHIAVHREEVFKRLDKGSGRASKPSSGAGEDTDDRDP